MTMVYASPPPRRARDSEADVDTRIFVRSTPPQAWDRAMVLQIMSGLGVPAHARASTSSSAVRRVSRAARLRPVPPPDEPNVFLQPWTPADPIPPWATPAASSLEETLVRPGRRHRSKLPWFLFLAAFGLAFGIGQDRKLRAELASELHAAKVHAGDVLESSAMRAVHLGRRVAGR